MTDQNSSILFDMPDLYIQSFSAKVVNRTVLCYTEIICLLLLQSNLSFPSKYYTPIETLCLLTI